MKWLGRLTIGLVVLIVGLWGVSFFMPGTFSVQRTDVIPLPPDDVYARYATPRTWADWSEWSAGKDPTLVYTYSGPDSGVGATMRWTSRKMGSGHLTISEAVPGDHVRYELRMDGSDMQVHGHVAFAPEAAGTRVTWHDQGTVGSNPIYRLMSPMMDSMLGKAFEESFAHLKQSAKTG